MTYDGPVCYQDGWHMTVVTDAAGNETPGKRLYLEDDGSYRTANKGDESWHDRKHGQFATIALEDGTPGLTVTADELDAIEAFLVERRTQ